MRAHSNWRIGAFATIAMLVGAQAGAQQRPAQPGQFQPGQQVQQQGRQQRTTLRPQQGESMADREIAAWLILGNEAEIQLAQWAANRAQDKQVKQFAEMMVKQHTETLDQLRQFAPDTPKLQIGQQSAGPAGRQTERPQEQVAAQPQNAPAGQTQTSRAEIDREGQRGLPFTLVAAEIAQRNLNGLEKELGEKKGSHFDHAFMGTQMMSHLALYNAQEVLRSYASPQLQNILDQSIQTTQSHWQQAKQVCEALEKDKEGHRSESGGNQ
jgi:predicted outer membrane protein